MKKFIIYFLIIGFLLNLAWEFLQAPLFEINIPASWIVPFLFFMTLWDVATIFVILLIGIFLNKKYKLNLILVVFIISILHATVSEMIAQTYFGLWSPKMLIMPYLGIAVTPMFQLALTAVVSIILSKRISKDLFVS